MPRSDVWARMWNKISDYDSPGSYYFNEKFMKALDAHIADPEHNPAILVDTEGIQHSSYTPATRGGPMSETQTGWMSSIESLLLCNSIMPVFQVAQNATTIMLLSVIKTSPVFFVMAMIRTNVLICRSTSIPRLLTGWI